MGELIGFELNFALNSILMGLKIIIAYDILRIFRIVIKHGAVFENIEDFIFSNIAGLFVFGMIYSCNGGIIRGFSLFLVGFTIWLYNVIISRFVINIVNRAVKYIRKTLKKCTKKYRMKKEGRKTRKDFVYGKKKRI